MTQKEDIDTRGAVARMTTSVSLSTTACTAIGKTEASI